MAFYTVDITRVLTVGAIKNRLQIIRGQPCIAKKLYFIIGELMEPFFKLCKGVHVAIEQLFSLCHGQSGYGFIQIPVTGNVIIDIMKPFIP